jgi:lipoate-protein ligase A
MSAIWRVLDTGLALPSRNIALTRALLEARSADEIPGTLRFARSTRCVLLGYLESAEQVLDLVFCREHGIPLQRRLTNSRAEYVDERQLLWELHVHRRDVGTDELSSLVRRICHAAATALSTFGVDARYRAPGDIEVDGRVIATAAGVKDREAIVVQGTLFGHWDAVNATSALRSGRARFNSSATVKEEAVVGLDDILGCEPPRAVIKHNLGEAFESEFDIEFREGDLSLSEDARLHAIMPHIECDDWILLAGRPASEMPILEASHPCAGGVLHVSLAYNTQTRRIREVWLSGDLALHPARTVFDLEAALRDIPVASLPRRVEWFFASRVIAADAVKPADIVTLIQRAVQQPLLARNT